MKVVFLSLYCYDKNFLNEINDHQENPDYFDEVLLANHPDPVHKWCKMLLMRNIDIEFWYFSCLQKKSKAFIHMYGHKTRRIPAFQLKNKIPIPDKIAKKFDGDITFKVFKMLKEHKVTHVLLLGYLLNKRHLVDMADMIISYCKFNDIKIFPIYGGDSILNYKKIKRTLKLYFLKKSSGFFSQSESEIEIMVKKLQFPSEKIFKFKNPLDLENFYPISRDKCLKHLKKDKRFEYILFVGRIELTKGIYHLINIFPKLLEKFKNIKLIIIGRGSTEEKLLRKIKLLNISENVIFKRFVENEKLKYYYNLSKVLILPSYSEGTPNILMEAIACNTVCIGTNVGGIPDLLSDGVGILIPPKDEEALYSAVRSVLVGGFKINQKSRNELLEEIDINRKSVELGEILKNSKY